MSIKDVIFKEPVEDQVYRLIDDARKLNEESSKLWYEIFNSSEVPSYKVPILLDRYEKLKSKYDNITNTYNVLYNEDLNAKKISGLKVVALILASVAAIMTDIYYGILLAVGVVEVFKTNHVMNKIKAGLKDSLENIDFTGIDINIDNSGRFLRSIIISDFNTPHTEIDVVANNYIHMYINGRIDSDRINDIPDDIKNMIISILKRDLNSDSDNLISLLDEVKKRYTDTNAAKTKAKK